MNLDRYIQGIRKGRDINYLEREAMRDPFLADALEGYDHVKGEHLERINAMKKQIIQQTRPKNNLFRYWSIAAVALLVIATGVYLLQNKLPHLTDDFYTKLPEIKPDANTAAIDTIAIDTEKTDAIQPDSLPVPDYFFKKQDTTSFFIARFEYVAKTSMDSLLGPLIIKKIGEKQSEEKPAQPETIVPGPKPAVGYKEYENYLRREMIRPVEDDCEGVKGKVVLAFSINGNGRPYDISVERSLCPSLDAEAIRLLREGPGWISGDRSARVEVRF
jgi:hypothetical protein